MATSVLKRNIKDYRKFNLLLLTTALFPVLSIGAFNVLIDPYGVIYSPAFPGLNWLKPEQDKHNKLFKTIDIIRFKPTTILIGSSRAVMGLDPNHPGLADRQNAYNLGIPGMHMRELSQYLRHALDNQPKIKQVVIGLDFFMFNGNVSKNKAQPDETLGKTSIPIQSLINVIFSWETLESSQITVASNQKGLNLIPYYSKGMRNNEPKINPHLNEPLVPIKARFKIDISNYLNNTAFYKNYRLDSSLLQEYKELVELCNQKNIELKIFISPESAAQLEAIRAAGLWSGFEQWKREVSQITPVWDFSSYNSITTEPITNEMKYFVDGTHYRKEVGDLILNRILNYNPKIVKNDFGILITPKNIESHLDKIRTEREVWSKKHPDVVKWVQGLKLSPARKR